MPTTELEIDRFAEFAKQQLGREGGHLTLDELVDRWRIAHPTVDDARAVAASLRDMERGEGGRSFDDFTDEFCAGNNLPKTH